MKDEDILRLAEPFLSMRDTAQPMIRGREDLIAFGQLVADNARAEMGSKLLESVIGPSPAESGSWDPFVFPSIRY